MKTFNINMTSPTPLIPASTVMNATINSAPMPLQDVISYDFQIVFTGVPTGSFKLQKSDDPVSAATASFLKTSLPVNWTDIANTSQAVTAAGNISLRDPLSWPGYAWVRVVYSDTSSGMSTAIITVANFNGKGF